MKITTDEIEFLVYCIKMSLDALLLRLSNGQPESLPENCFVGLETENIKITKWHIKMSRSTLDKLLPHVQDRKIAEAASKSINWFEEHVSFADDEPDSTEILVARYLMGILVDEALKND